MMEATSSPTKSGDSGMQHWRQPSSGISANISDYVVNIEISFPDPSMASQIKQFLTTELIPLSLDGGNTNVTSIAITTACNQTGLDVQCSCESGYIWPSEVCPSLYSPCPGTSSSSCSCIKGTTFPTQFCSLPTVDINFSLKILQEFDNDLYNPSSAKYIKFKTDLEDQFNKTYVSLPGFKSATIKSFRPGSVMVDYTVVTEPTTTASLTTANSNLITNLNSSGYQADSVKTEVAGILVTAFPRQAFVNEEIAGSGRCSLMYQLIGGKGWTNISTYPTNIFPSDKVTITCTVNVSTYSDVSWYFNRTTKIQTNSAVSVTTTSISGFVQTNLTISGVSFVNSESCPNETTNPELVAKTAFPNVVLGRAALVEITTKSENISEWTSLTLVCTCSYINVQAMSWSFTGTGGISNSINDFLPTNNLQTCNSTLTIPADSMSISWNGSFQCLVNNGIISASKTINVFRLAKPSEIKRSPIQTGFLCGNNVNFLCCLDANINAYKPDKTTLQIYNGLKIPSETLEMTRDGNCFTRIYTVPAGASCTDFTATCTITNLIDSTVTSDTMTLNKINDPKCTNEQIPNANLGYGAAGSSSTVDCQNIDENQTGKIIYTCNNSMWTEVKRDCVLKVLNNLNQQVEELKSPGSEAKVPNILDNLNSAVTANQSTIISSASNIQLVVTILQGVEGVVTKVEQDVMANFLSTVSVVVDNTTTSTWNSFSNKVNESSNLLKSVENFADKLTVDGPVNITNKNVQLVANLVSKLPPEGYNAIFSFNEVNNLTGNINIKKSFLNSGTKIVSIAYPTLKDIIGVAQNSSNETVGGLVMTTLYKNDIDFLIEMDFKKSNSTLNKARCVYWNFTTQNWDDTGCTVNNSKGENVTCACNHLTSFSILMSTSEDNVNNIVLEYITYIGVGISMFSLVICIIIEAMVWKSVTKNKTSYMRHLCIMNIAVTLLMADIWFIIGAAMNTTDKVQACIASTFFAHVFYLCVFFWMLTMGLILFYRLMCVFHDLSKTIMMGISFFLGYGCPIIISVITVAVTQPHNTYLATSACWLNILESKAFLAFILPALTILLVNFITLLVVIVKVLRPSVGDKPKKEEKSSLNHIAKCILILTPLLGLTWGFGIGTMSSSSVVILGIFAALNSLQGLFILLFGCLMDKKVRDALFSRFSVSRWSSQQTKSSHLSSATEPTSAKKGISGINLFAKKGVYHISSAQMSSSSDMASSNSYSLLT
ncbi:adhesion G protein-coupled receptor F5 [Gastrophryne carolinensis]